MTTIDTATPAVDSAGLIGARRQTSAPRPRTVPASLDQHPDLVDVDVVRARQMVPRAAVAGGSRALPAVDLDVWLLHVRYARGRHPAIRAKLVEEYRGYAVGLARRLHREGESLEDLIQVAMEALLLAIDRFDPSRYSISGVGHADDRRLLEAPLPRSRLVGPSTEMGARHRGTGTRRL